ncbi:xylitol dehydrogenase [Lobulomyces angularis]|nr:xylitol dehydrogenase [Lobulomyces angularis]
MPSQLKNLEVKNHLSFSINGKLTNVCNPRISQTLADYLRYEEGLTGTKVACNSGGCGACTVIQVNSDHTLTSINSCLTPLVKMEGTSIITIEGLGDQHKPNVVQQRIRDFHGRTLIKDLISLILGSPGFAMSLFSLIKNEGDNLNSNSIENNFIGNICRCTGYRPILDGAKSFIGNSCNSSCSTTKSHFTNNYLDIEDLVPFKCNHSEEAKSYYFEDDKRKWFCPNNLNDLFDFMKKYPDSEIVSGNTQIGITNLQNEKKLSKNLIFPMNVKEFKIFEVSKVGVTIGACLTISEAHVLISKLIGEERNNLEEFEIKGLTALLSALSLFAGVQIRNVATIGGSVMCSRSNSELNSCLMGLDSVVNVCSEKGVTDIKFSNFYLGDTIISLKKGEIIKSIFLPFTKKAEFVQAIVNSCFKIKVNHDLVIEEAVFAFGGMHDATSRAKHLEEGVIGKVLSKDKLINELLSSQTFDKENFSISAGQLSYRKTLAASFLQKFFSFVVNEMAIYNEHLKPLEEKELSILTDSRSVSTGKQFFEGQESESITHLSSTKHLSGDAVYVDDIPKQPKELFACWVGSAHAHAKVLSVDVSKALLMNGVVGYIDAKDIPENGSNDILRGEQLFNTETEFVGHMIGLIVAKNEETARKALELVKVEYEILPTCFTIEEAIEKKSFFCDGPSITFERGEFVGHDDDLITLEGSCKTNPQEHFYLETNVSLVIPQKEDNEFEIWMSTQDPTATQANISKLLGVQRNKVSVRVKRLGGGFGGKESRAYFLTAACTIAANKFGVPVRSRMTRSEDMSVTGQRHPVLAFYKISFTKMGKIVSFEVDVYNNAGFVEELSSGHLQRVLMHLDNCYNINNFRANGFMAKTNLPSNRAFRGFGAPQGMMIIENAVEKVAKFLKTDVSKVRELNFYKTNDKTHFNEILENVYIGRIWSEIKENSNFEKRSLEVENFNKLNKFKKRGISLIPTKFGIGFPAYLMQGGALINVYIDGTVLISHGGLEMGQGLHTKMLQIASRTLGIPVSKIHIKETNTDIVPNTAVTAASISTDLNGMAVLNGCEILNERLKPLRESKKDLSWEQLIAEAYMERIDLSARGFYKATDMDYNWELKKGRINNYFTYGAAVTEVEIDVLTGAHTVMRTDILMDVGKSINPALDIGQIEGGFIQGLGWCTIEDPLISSKTGKAKTICPDSYKVPGTKDIPLDFRVSLLKGSTNKRAVFSSKGIGEPPLFLGTSVFFAIRSAIQASRIENNKNVEFTLNPPATSEKIRMLCEDNITDSFQKDKLIVDEFISS